MKVDDVVVLKNRIFGDPRSTGRVREVFKDNTYVSVWWTMSNQDDETPPGVMIQKEPIESLKVITDNEDR